MYFEGYDNDLEYGVNDAFDWDFGLDNGQSSMKQKAKKKVANKDPLEMSGDNEVDPPHVHTHPNFREMYHLETGYDTRHNEVFCVEWLSSKLS